MIGVGCVTSIRPPEDPPDPVLTVLVDYGYHSSLILPAPGGNSIEYAFGDWDYFALNDDGWCVGLAALCFSGQGTLGCRTLHAPTDSADLRALIPCEEMYDLMVARADMDALRRTLEERYQRHVDAPQFNPKNGLTFVKDDETYGCFNNCNHVVMGWLRELKCTVSRPCCFANFRLEAPRDTRSP